MSVSYSAVAKFFERKRFYQRVIVLALPIVIQNFLSSFLNMIDTVMVGKLGEMEIAAVGLANQYFFFFNMLLIGISAGCGVFVSQFWGKRDAENIRRIVGIGLGSATLASLVFMILGYLLPKEIIAVFSNETQIIELGAKYLRIVLASYLFTGVTFIYSFSLRSLGNTILPMVISGVSLVCNAFFNYVFIFGKFGAPAMGVEGAALATVIARVLETTVLVTAVYWQKTVLAASLRELADVTVEYIKKAYQTIFPVILNDICWGLATLVYAAVYGRMGAQAVAAVQIVNTVTNLFMVVIFGLSNAAAVMVGNSIGAGKIRQGRVYAGKFAMFSVVVGVLLGLLLAAVSPAILGLFNVSAQVWDSARRILYIVSVIFAVRILDVMLIVGVLRGGGDAHYAFVIEGCTMWFIGVPLTIIGAFLLKLPVHLVYALAIAEEIAKCIFSLRRLRSGLWMKNVTRNMSL